MLALAAWLACPSAADIIFNRLIKFEGDC